MLISGRLYSAEIPQPLRASYFHPNQVIPRDGTLEEQTTAIQTALDRFESSGFNAIFPYFTGSAGDAYYPGSIHATQFYRDRDPLGELIRKARERQIQVYYHHDKYGEKYLTMFEQKMRSAVELNRGTGRPVPLSFALGVVTSHGRVHSAEDIRIYLNKAAEVQLDGFAIFTWNDLLPFLNELDQTGDIRNFPAP